MLQGQLDVQEAWKAGLFKNEDSCRAIKPRRARPGRIGCSQCWRKEAVVGGGVESQVLVEPVSVTLRTW